MAYRKANGWGFIKPPVGSVVDWNDPITMGLVVRFLCGPAGDRTPDATGRWTGWGGLAIGGRPGRFGAPCWHFDGLTYFVGIANAMQQNTGIIKGLPFSVSVWMCQTVTSTPVHGFASCDTGTNDHFVLVAINSITNKFQVTSVGVAGGSAISTLLAVPGVWYHVVGVWTSTTDRKLYINGRFETLDTTAVTTNFATLDNTTVGAFIRQTGTFGQGKVDNLAIYNRALMPTEIVRLYNEPFAGIAAPRRRIIGTIIGGRWNPLSGRGGGKAQALA